MSSFFIKAHFQALVNVGADLAGLVSGRVSVELDARLAYDTRGIVDKMTKRYNYIHKYGHKSKLMAVAARNKQDLLSLLGVDYIFAPLRISQSLKDSVTYADEKYLYLRTLSLSSAKGYNFSEEDLVKWDQMCMASAMGPCAEKFPMPGWRDTRTKRGV